MESGDWLVIYTDGVVEAMNQSNEEYGEQRLLNVLNAGAAIAPAEMLRRVMATWIRSWAQRRSMMTSLACW